MTTDELKMPKDFARALGWSTWHNGQRYSWQLLVDDAEALYWQRRDAVVAERLRGAA